MHEWSRERRNTLVFNKEESESSKAEQNGCVYFCVYNSNGFVRSVTLPIVATPGPVVLSSSAPQNLCHSTKLLRSLGAGGFSQVFLGKDLRSGQLLAVKITETRQPAHKKAADNEAAILKRLGAHPTIVRCHEYKTFEQASIIYLEYFPSTELFHLLKKCRVLSFSVVERIAAQLLSGVAFLHQQRICHLDIKPENILINKQCQIKLIDFGMAQVALRNGQVEAYGGSVKYASPEALLGGVYNGFLADAWSCGVVLFLIMYGRFPDPANLVCPAFPAAPAVQESVARLLKIDPEKRAPIWSLPQTNRPAP